MGDIDNFILTEFSKSVFIEKQIVDQHVQLEFTGLNQKVLIFFTYSVLFGSALGPNGMGGTVTEKYQKPLISPLVLLTLHLSLNVVLGRLVFKTIF